MTPLEDAQEFVLGSCPPKRPVAMRREDANGLVLATAVVSTEIVPPFDNTAVDGYAVRSADVATASTAPVDLVVAGEIAAGAAPAAISPATTRSTGDDEAVATSALRTAYPSTAVLSNGGTISVETTAAANTRPFASSRGIVTGRFGGHEPSTNS